MSTILPYPGGKHYGVKTLLPLVPPNVKVMSPFAGGCSLELAIADPLNNRSFIYHDVRVQAYDIFEPLLKVDYGDFTDTIPNHPDEFLYCDPPYALSLEVARKRKEDDLYGMAGSLHRDFDHAALRDLLVDREGWLLSYNDCKEVRQWYEGCWIEERTWRHSIDSGAKMGKELVIRP